jgi:FkbM family methyltransferase
MGEANNGYMQAMLMLAEVLCRTQITLDNPIGKRLLHLLAQLMPDLIFPNIRLGIYSIGDRELEGLVYLHRASELAADRPIILQSLQLAYRDLERLDLATYWQELAIDYGNQRLAKLPWRWTELSLESFWTYIPFVSSDDREILLSVPASLQSYTTRCLLAEGDWFERELEFWRQYIQPGMTVVDIGANVGIYAFSAAQRVGEQGMVYAIEAHSAAVDCLDETCRVNQIENVKVFKNAVGDLNGQVRLVLQSNSELNYIVTDLDPIDPDIEIDEVTCVTLDIFVQQLGIDRVEVIKISTEGNELAVLMGCERILTEFAPTIIYNSYTTKGINLAAAEYLLDRGYELFRYQPYLQQLIPLVNESDFAEVLKAIAIPK